MIAADASVAVALLSSWHPAHAPARAAVANDSERTLPGHAAFETVAVLSRLPDRYRIAATVAHAALERAFPAQWLTLDGDGVRESLRKAVAAGIRGGAVYDALIAATAREHGATLLSADRRALPAYEAIGARVEFVS